VRDRAALIGAALLAMVLAFTLFRPPATGGPPMRDLEAYWSAGATWNAGGTPYDRSIWHAETQVPEVDASRDELLPFVGPAAFRPLYQAIALVPFLTAVRIWGVVLALSFLTLLGAGLVLGRDAPRTIATLLAVLALGFAFGPVIATFALGQAALPSAAGVAATTLLIDGTALAATAAVAAVFLAALQPNLALALVPLACSRRGLAICGTAFLLFAAATLAFGGGFAGLAAYVHVLGSHGDAERFITIQTTPAAIAYAAGASEGTARAIGWAIAAVALVAAIGGCVGLRRDRPLATAFACAMVPLVAPFFHEHDLTVVLIPVLVLAMRARGAVAAGAAVATTVVGIDWLGFAQRENAHGQIVALGLAVAFAYAALAREPRLRYRLAGLAPIALAALLLPLTALHPAPTWPDALGAFHSPVAASAGAVWGLEQRASGLAARDGVWALLRALSLAGAGGLAIAVFVHGRIRVAAKRRAPRVATAPTPMPV
jgi:hypothetical protein